jgi:hypothetical protein
VKVSNRAGSIARTVEVQTPDGWRPRSMGQLAPGDVFRMWEGINLVLTPSYRATGHPNRVLGNRTDDWEIDAVPVSSPARLPDPEPGRSA